MGIINKVVLVAISFVIGSVLTLSCVYFCDLIGLKENTGAALIKDDEILLIPLNKETTSHNQSNFSDSEELLKQTITQQAETIRILKSDITRLSSQITSFSENSKHSSSKNENPNETGNAPLKKMAMEDFQDIAKETFIDKFKGVVLSISGKQLESLKNGFENNSDQDDRTIAYQNNISDYLLDNNPYSEHYVDDIRCQGDICRLEISTSNEETWEQIYANMTRQDWYTSITFEEDSNYPGQHIYYLPNITEL